MKNAYHFAKEYALYVNCLNLTTTDTNTRRLVSCLRSKSSDELVEAQASTPYFTEHLFAVQVGVVIDGEFVVDRPQNILRNESSESHKMFKSLDFITGNVYNEGNFAITNMEFYTRSWREGEPSTFLCGNIIPFLIQNMYPNSPFTKLSSKAICNKYINVNSPEQARLITDMFRVYISLHLQSKHLIHTLCAIL